MRTSQRGGALLAVLWLSVALSAIAFSVATNVRGETERASTATDGLRAYYLASGSLDRAMLWIYWGLWGGYANEDGTPKFYRAPMPYIRYNYESGEVLVEVIPEGGKLNANRATPEELMRLLIALGLPDDRARQIALGIVDYRTAAEASAGPPSITPTGPGGSTFRPRHASLEELEEILLVPGMTPDIFYGRFDRDPGGRLIPRGGLRDCLTVFGFGQVDINTAPETLLESFGVPPAVAGQIVARRIVAPFKSMDEVQPVLTAAGVEPGKFGIGGSSLWTLRATARLRLANGKYSDVRRTVAATVRYLQNNQANPPYHVLRWYDDAWTPFVPPM